MSDYAQTMAYYNVNAENLSERYLTLKSETLYEKLIPVLQNNTTKGEILEIGGGSGRDAVYFGSLLKKDVYIAEPSDGLRFRAMKHLASQGYKLMPRPASSSYHPPMYKKDGQQIFLFNDKLPHLRNIRNVYDAGYIQPMSFINVNAVWQHINPSQERDASAVILSNMLAPGGIISVKGRNKPSPEQTGIAWDTTAGELREQFRGLKEILVEEQPDYSKPDSNLTFINAVFQKPA